MVVFRFEKLEVWQLAVEFCGKIYRVTALFPDSERFGLTNQLRRAAASVPTNIAEGAGRTSNRDNVRFIEISYGSLMEIVSLLEIARQQEWLSDDDRSELRMEADRLARMLSGLRNHLQTPPRNP